MGLTDSVTGASKGYSLQREPAHPLGENKWTDETIPESRLWCKGLGQSEKQTGQAVAHVGTVDQVGTAHRQSN